MLRGDHQVGALRAPEHPADQEHDRAR
jgi:hypothetical protein